MGEKSKGKDSGKVKKAKTQKAKNRPHEERLRQQGQAAIPASILTRPAELD